MNSEQLARTGNIGWKVKGTFTELTNVDRTLARDLPHGSVVMVSNGSMFGRAIDDSEGFVTLRKIAMSVTTFVSGIVNLSP